jgi:type I protein arginine methyltransferase
MDKSHYRLIRGKVESISLPEDCPKVDVIISEWMGYALLYESMLDSVLVARDRFLRRKDQASAAPERPLGFKGVMVPSQCRMVLALCDPQGLIKQRVGFWRDVYGFDMSSMATEAFEEAIVECVPKEEVLSSSCVVKVQNYYSPPFNSSLTRLQDLDLQTISSKNLSFSSSFVLKANELPTSPAAKVKSGNAYFFGKLHAHRTFATAFVLWSVKNLPIISN